jgi:hypothetical protein
MLPQEIRFINDFNVLDLSYTGDKAQTLNFKLFSGFLSWSKSETWSRSRP